MQVSKKVSAAIAAAVGMYLEAEQQMPAVSAEERLVREAPLAAQSPWAMAGRQSMMEMRRLFQLRFVR